MTHARDVRDPRSPGGGRALRRILFGALLVAVLVLGGTVFRVWQVAGVEQRRPADMIVVLGAAQYNGEPSAVLKARLQHALSLYEQGYAEHIVTVGGNQEGDNYTEAQASRMWLVDHGVPSHGVEDVETGKDTLRSIRAVGDLAEQRDWQTALIVSDPWHSWRSRTMANEVGLRAWSSPTRVGPTVDGADIRRQYIIRETAAMLYYRLSHASADVSGMGLN
ncbi:vancomycin permeability regulator SanA [Saccharopolyspora lacisalsi]|uniref:Vancomycin permeability regulator SanA n=1 Tax=Halosaccharopolyspora lacisalsi TaxID=1000566 RepID=A0A839E235_9PSEU|nr:YdcF family protein [Halosaccharopolyspora lacisalsi]MBA8825471.1 vancomycin permeability regulator SanA [Halosaccharopolyspora lacisalsi]